MEDGLPDNNIFVATQDKNGILWFSSNAGLISFDGYNFQTYNEKDGIANAEIWSVDIDHHGTLWFGNLGPLSYYNGAFNHVPKYQDISPHRHFNVGENHFFRSYSNQLYKVVSNDSIQAYNFYGNYLFNDKDSFEYLCHDNVKGLTIEVFKNGKTISCLKSENVFDQNTRFYSNSFDQNAIIYAANRAWYFDGLNIKEVPINNFFKDKNVNIEYGDWVDENTFYLYNFKGEFVILDKSFNELSSFDFLKDLQTNSVFKDRVGNYWICTKNGIYFKNKGEDTVLNFKLPTENVNEDILVIETDNFGKLWIGASRGNLYHLDTRANKIDKHFTNKGSFPIKDIIIKDDKLYYATNNLVFEENLPVLKSNNLAKSYELRYGLKSFFLHGENDLYVSFPKTIAKYKLGNELHEFSYKGTRQLEIQSNSAGEILFAGKEGIMKLKNDNLAFLNLSHKIVKESVTKMKVDSLDNIWLGIGSNGLFRIIGNSVDTIKNTLDARITDIEVSHNGTVYASSQKGIFVIKLDHNNQVIESLIVDKSNGLSTNIIFGLAINDTHLFAHTQDRIMQIELQDLESKVYNHASLVLSDLFVNKTKVKINDSYAFDYDENNVEINFVAISFEQLKNITYMYMLKGWDNDWYSTNTPKVSFDNLPAGNYTFIVNAYDKNSIQLGEEQSLEFQILNPWWASSVLKSFLLLLAGFFIYRFARWRSDKLNLKNKEKQDIERKLTELKIEALQAQMNPHFIFNALQSIQDFIFKHDEYEANKYIVKFSKLMRFFLELSKEKQCTLDEEIQMIELYIELEKLRFNDLFDYTIDVASDVDTKYTLIPSMVIQPFVENAINHGLYYLDNKGQLTIKVWIKNELLYCSIEDNGVGRIEAERQKNNSLSKTKSRGMQILKEREAISKISNKMLFDFNIVDLESNGIACGTKVTVRFNTKHKHLKKKNIS